jgi:glycosyltransferase involved in cell wall biosynthesis
MTLAPLRVLIVSENISMRMGGESSLPFYYAKLFTARGAQVWLACHERVRDEVRQALPELAERTFFVEDSLLQKLMFRYTAWLPYRIRDLLVGQLIHYSTQWRLRKRAVDLASRKLIDVVFESSPITPKGLSFMYRIGVPVVIGPLCGGMEFPPAFRSLDSWVARNAISLSRAFSKVANRLVPGKPEADVILVANAQTERALPTKVRGDVIRLFESGVDLHLWSVPANARPKDGEVRFVFSGRFVDWKGIQYLLPAFERVAATESSCRLELIGGGGEFEREVQELANRESIRDRVRLHGWVPRERAAEILRDADVFVMPSLRECGGTAILEAMAMGKPVIATNWGGPADYVNERCGILVPPNSPEGFVQGLADAILLLAKSADLRRSLGAGGVQRVKEDYLAWDAKADRVLSILAETVARQATARPAI